MLFKHQLWSPARSGEIIRILSQGEDGCILYSWTPQDLTNLSTPIYIRHFDPSSEKDEVVLIAKRYAHFISASLSVDHQIITFTIWLENEKSKRLEVVVGNDLIDSGFLTQDIIDACPFKSHLLDSEPTERDGYQYLMKEGCESMSSGDQQNQYHKGMYKSYLAQVCPTGWFLKFNTGGKLSQRAVLTNYRKSRPSGDLKLLQYEVLLIMHNEFIGLYSVVLEVFNDSTDLRSCSDKNQPVNFPHKPRTRLYGKPTSEVIANRAIWSQWHASSQRLYYGIPSHRTRKSVKKIHAPGLLQFVCVQFFETMPRHKVFDIELDLGLSKFILHNKNCLFHHHELDPTIASSALNMRLCVFNDSGAMCLCWQELSSEDVKPKRNYSIAILNKDVVIHEMKNQQVECTNPVSFAPIGSNLLVHCPGYFIHLYDIESITSDKERVSNGLYHMHLQESSIPAVTGCSLEYLMPFSALDEIVDISESIEHSLISDSVDSLCSSSSSSYFGNGALSYDRKTKSFVLIRFDSKEFGMLISNQKLTMKNRVFLTRQAILSTRGNNSSSDPLIPVYESIMDNPTDPGVTGILSQLLIATASLELGDHRHNVPSGMIPLFPVTLPTSSLHRMISRKERYSDFVIYDYIDVRSHVKSQIEQYVATVSSSPRSPTLTSKKRVRGYKNDGSHTDERLAFTKEYKEALWYRTLSCTKSGTYTEYDMECIREEMTILDQDQFNDNYWCSSQQSFLRKRLSELFKRDFLKHVDMTSSNNNLLELDGDFGGGSILSFLNEAERDQRSENLMVLTSEKLCDHLSAQYEAGSNPETSSLDLARLSRDYVFAQLRAVYHTLTLIMLKSGVDGFERWLYSPASAQEQNLLFGLNQFQLVCGMISFPLPNGFHTFVTCLTFCCMLSKHTFYVEGEQQVNVDLLCDQFFTYVDKYLIVMTDEFVARTLEELGDKDMFSPFVREVLIRTRGLANDDLSSFGGLLQWKHPEAKRHLARAYIKKLFENSNFCPKSPDFSSTRDSFSRKRSSSSPKEQTVSSYLREKEFSPLQRMRSRTRSGSRNLLLSDESPPEHFPPLDALIDYVRKVEPPVQSEAIGSQINTAEYPVADFLISAALQNSK